MALYQVFFLLLLMGKNGEFLSTITQSHLFMGCIWKALILCIGGWQRSSARREGCQEIPVLSCFNKHWYGRTNMPWWWAHVRFLSFPECIVVIYLFIYLLCRVVSSRGRMYKDCCQLLQWLYPIWTRMCLVYAGGECHTHFQLFKMTSTALLVHLSHGHHSKQIKLLI